MPRKSPKPTAPAVAEIAQTLRSRIVSLGESAPDQLLANPLNFRRHPPEQLEALRGSIGTLGWVKPVLVNRVTGHVLDGHARVEEALRQEIPSIPVLYVDLTPDEEKLALAVLDPITGMAYQDDRLLTELLAGIQVDSPELNVFLAAQALEAAPPPPDLQEYDESDGPGEKATITCPHCQKTFHQ
jgi:ParB-like chromosome segregation protein Spo0J